MASKGVIILITADAQFGPSMKTHLAANGYDVNMAATLEQALRVSRTVSPSLFVLDRRVGSVNHIRGVFSKVPCLSIQPPDLPCSDEDCLQDLEGGADCAVCGETYRQITARVRAILRREQARPPLRPRCAVGGIAMDFDRYEVKIEGRPVDLTRKQYDILELLLLQPSRVFRKEEILTSVWGDNVAFGDHTVDVHIYALRRKIERDPAHPRFLQTVRGVGYKLTSA